MTSISYQKILDRFAKHFSYHISLSYDDRLGWCVELVQDISPYSDIDDSGLLFFFGGKSCYEVSRHAKLDLESEAIEEACKKYVLELVLDPTRTAVSVIDPLDYPRGSVEALLVFLDLCQD